MHLHYCYILRTFSGQLQKSKNVGCNRVCCGLTGENLETVRLDNFINCTASGIAILPKCLLVTLT